MNQVSFVFINWLEIIFLIIYWLRLRKVKQDQLNIKHEFKTITATWTTFSMIYFILVQVAQYHSK